MKIFLKTGGLIIFAALLAAAFAMPSAARYFIPQHWVTGTVYDADSGPTAEGRSVIVYFGANPSDFAQSRIGLSGAAKRSNMYMLNTFMIPGGTTWEDGVSVEVLSPVDVDTYSAGPVIVDTTGAGFDVAGEMTLESISGAVSIYNVKFDNVPYYSFPGSNMIIAPRPSITVMISVEEAGTLVSSVELYVDGAIKYIGTDESWWKPVVPVTFEYTFTSDITQGDHTMLIRAWGSSGVFGLKPLFVTVRGKGAPQIIGATLVYPAPFRPLRGENAIFAYNLSINTNVTLMVYDVSGRLILTRKFAAGTNGGRLGYNSFTWNGRTDLGGTVANGVFIFKIISGGRQLTSGKFVVLD